MNPLSPTMHFPVDICFKWVRRSVVGREFKGDTSVFLWHLADQGRTIPAGGDEVEEGYVLVGAFTFTMDTRPHPEECKHQECCGDRVLRDGSENLGSWASQRDQPITTQSSMEQPRDCPFSASSAISETAASRLWRDTSLPEPGSMGHQR